jgi:general secretion pathway protein M
MNNALLIRLRETWGGLSGRERRLATAGAALLALVLLYLLLWLPLQQELGRLRAGNPEAQEQLARMRTQASMIQPLRGRQRAAPAPGTVVSVVESTATARGLRKQISKIEADGGNGVQISADGIPFNSLIAWLADLREGNALVVDNASFDAHTASGTVNARLRLRVENP